VQRPDGELGAGEEHADREDDQRDAEEVGGDVAAVAMVARVLHHQLVGGAERAGHDALSPVADDRGARGPEPTRGSGMNRACRLVEHAANDVSKR
jgi:hypothetical protein